MARKNGFTVIELLVAAGVILLVSGGIITNYNDFNENQKVDQSATSLKTNLRSTQNKAVSGAKPSSGCTTLIGYQVIFSGTGYTSQALCEPEGLVLGTTNTVLLPIGVTFSPIPRSMIYYALTRGVEPSQTIILTGGRPTFGGGVPTSQVTVLATGAISEGIPNPITPTPGVSPTPTPEGPGDGLQGEYYDERELTGLVGTRVDTNVDFNWGSGKAHTAMTSSNDYSARWTGFVKPPTSDTYRFYANTDDGNRLWVNGQSITDRWSGGGSEQSGTISLTGGQKYSLKLEYYEGSGDAYARLRWQSSSIAKQAIPQTYLYTPAPTPPPTPTPTPSVLVSNLNRYVLVDNFTSGVTYYSDRTYTVTSNPVPTLLGGNKWIKTENDDKNVSTNPWVTFDISQGTDVYLLYDRRLTLPSWASGFSNTGDTVNTSDSGMDYFRVYKKSYPVGTVSLGGNQGGGNSMYIVVIEGT